MNRRVLIRRHNTETRCLVAPHPDVLAEMRQELQSLRESAPDPESASFLSLEQPSAFGLDDGVILPPEEFELGTPLERIRAEAAERAPLRGPLNVLVVLVQFSDAALARPKKDFEDIFFAPKNSVAEFYREASGGLVDITGKVVGPFTLPRTLAAYANNASGTGARPNAQTMARDAADAARADINRTLDNDGNGFVDAFIVVHAGGAAEETRKKTDIWSHKWVLDGGPFTAPDGTNVFAYLTVPENCRVGVCAHEMGHLLFGWPDLYDTDYSSEGIGDWCLMAGGSWNGRLAGAQPGDVPAHPSAWCKANQGWVNVIVQSSNAPVAIADVHTSRNVFRLWKDGDASSTEYFLVENRQRTGFDRALDGSGLLIWHIDDSISSNANENHYKVALMQADGQRQLERAVNRGDGGDPYPGSSGNAAFDATTTPSSSSYSGLPTSVAVTNIPASSPSMTVNLTVTTQPTRRRRRTIGPIIPEAELPVAVPYVA
jgi:immune inhibitor A